MRKLQLFLLLIFAVVKLPAQQEKHIVKHLKITILSTMLAQAGIGEWGFSALVEADSNKILFDAGGHERTVLENAKELNIDLSNVPVLILSHWHDDHTTGWLPLRNTMDTINKQALAITHVGFGFFYSRFVPKGTGFTNIAKNDSSNRRNDSLLYIKTGGKIVEHNHFEEIFPGVYLTGPVPRQYPEKNYPPGGKIKDASGNLIEDNIPEDMSLVIRTDKGLVLLTGCGHAGIINTVTYSRNNLQHQPLLAAIGGFHLLQNTDEQIKWTAEQLKASGIHYFMGAHCTGIEPVYQIREWASLKRGECIVGSVGDTFDLAEGFTTGALTK
jgi:7,8-dihydropterin-6-yl-methyl-4-(beta-D-ribofuranosyl)aminobenzene 5'-phosphate synthase